MSDIADVEGQPESGPEAPPTAASPSDGVATLEHIEQELARVEAALARLDDGTYNTCAICGETIPDADLAIDPLTTACLMHTA